MRISGFSYIRNGFTYQYPFLAAIQSVLPLCDEFCVAVGDSNDETREALVALNDPRIRIIDTIWDETMRGNGKIFAQQANIALDACTGDWLFHIQADEVMHERDLPIIRAAMEAVDDRPDIDGLLFDFLNFHGSYDYLNNTRKQHKKEIRVFRNGINAYAYRDSQGFRKYTSFAAYEQGETGTKLRVKYVPVPVHHYSFVRPAEQMFQKWAYFRTFYGRQMDEPALHTLSAAPADVMVSPMATKQFDYYNIFRIKRFEGTHPAVMQPYIAAAPNDFDPTKIHHVQSLKDKVVYAIEDRLKYRFGEWKNYRLVE
ncbi:glycosyltransferase family 2 protein [Fibrella sp. HMF5335]|uniref:Glycosyltransferase family 2 protein n=1 Tax=Fibrella rubiginis TaxID=2817060 RepID=A0A939GG67_9BACT|nr:glycosyltransferase family 2 protein [Fibrella rubiginis]MBO0936141.1 glycosyltransferase family 2 protein [Fibrella rubiginis]